MLDVVFEICSMPRNFRKAGNKSMVQLLKESAYFGHEDSVTKQEIVEVIRSHPGFIEDWVDYSADQRVPSGWYLEQCDVEKWIVGYYNGIKREKEQAFTSGYEACATFILMEVALLAQHSH